MAEQTLQTTKEAKEEKVGKPVKNGGRKQMEALYTVEELSNAAGQQFGKRPELVKAALLAKGEEKYSVKTAKAVVEEFSKRKVI